MEPAPLLLGSGAASLRRRVGPLAWCALEALVARSRPVVDGSVAEASVRVIADDLGVAANTAHRALKTLRTAGVVEHYQSRTGTGLFDVSSYRLIVPVEVLRLCASLQQKIASRKPARRTRPAAPAAAAAVNVGQQLVLLPSD